MADAVALDPISRVGSIAVYVGRQPIYDRSLQVYAYELLFRGSSTDTRAILPDDDRATARVFVNTFMELGLSVVADDKPAFINLTRTFIEGDFARLFPADRTMLEILETVTVDESLLAEIEALKKDGYKIVLDDFEFRDELEPLVKLADIVKLDVLAHPQEAVREVFERLRTYGVKLLAEKIETHEDFVFCRDLGFDYFQGFFLSKPQTVVGHRLPTDRLALLQLLAKVNDPTAEVGELVSIISRDVSLSYKLVKYINSAAFAFSTKVESVQHALVLLGKSMARCWVNLVILSGIVDKPHELLVTAMIRAKMCEYLAAVLGDKRPEMYFTAGLFSTLDALMDCPMEQALSELPIAEELKTAIISHQGEIGEALHCVINYERARWENVRCAEVAANNIQDAYIQALKWINSARGAMT